MNAKLKGKNLANRRAWRGRCVPARGAIRFAWTAKWCRLFGTEASFEDACEVMDV